ncbi:hypothetical protein SAY86_016347 [Trapa natans]|uniref:EF-hand domain-containing protein n=1 Tax=Trapa natans TaxID=22666 RepID=A0AAN7LJF8_TRANT|nr:hypothetical protein SAY86_016347 [Trapa natans]
MREAFNVFDQNGDGFITVEELRSVLASLGLKQGRTIEDCKKMIKKVDVDGDGMVNFSTFKVTGPGSIALLSRSSYSSPCLCSGLLDISFGYREAATKTTEEQSSLKLYVVDMKLQTEIIIHLHLVYRCSSSEMTLYQIEGIPNERSKTVLEALRGLQITTTKLKQIA